jgi:hypothetical protein
VAIAARRSESKALREQVQLLLLRLRFIRVSTTLSKKHMEKVDLIEISEGQTVDFRRYLNILLDHPTDPVQAFAEYLDACMALSITHQDLADKARKTKTELQAYRAELHTTIWSNPHLYFENGKKPTQSAVDAKVEADIKYQMLSEKVDDLMSMKQKCAAVYDLFYQTLRYIGTTKKEVDQDTLEENHQIRQLVQHL